MREVVSIKDMTWGCKQQDYIEYSKHGWLILGLGAMLSNTYDGMSVLDTAQMIVFQHGF